MTNTERNRRKRHGERAEALKAFGGKCAVCEIDDPIIADLDHVNDDGFEHRTVRAAKAAFSKRS